MKYLLLNEEGKIIGKCEASNIWEATQYFDDKVDDIFEIISEEDYIADKQSEEGQ